jgi:hypothetical protein
MAFEKKTSFVLVFCIMILAYIRFFYASVVNIVDQLGLLACTFTIIMFGSPLLSLSQVLKTKSAAGYISLPVILIYRNA